MQVLYVIILFLCLGIKANAEIGEINVHSGPPPERTVAAPEDRSVLWLKTGTRVVVVLVDAQGKKVGVDATSFKTLKEIPGSECEVDLISNKYTGEEHVEAYEHMTLTPAHKGTYRLLLHGLQTGPYEISASSLSRDGSSEPTKDLEGMITEGEDKILTLTFDPAPHSALSLVEISK